MLDTVRRFNWTPENLERARVLSAEGRSAAQIALDLGTTRNAVIGKLHRSGITKIIAVKVETSKQRELRLRREERAAQVRLRQSQAPVLPWELADSRPAASTPVEVAVPACGPEGGILLTDATEKHCRFPAELPLPPTTDMRVCGAAVVRGTSWCAHHFHRVFTNSDRMIERLQQRHNR